MQIVCLKDLVQTWILLWSNKYLTNCCVVKTVAYCCDVDNSCILLCCEYQLCMENYK